MAPHSIPELDDLLISTQLLTSSEISECRSEIHAGTDVDEYLQILERKQLLTAFQTGKIRKGEFEGLVLGGCKLLYKNASGSFARVYRVSRISDGRMLGMKSSSAAMGQRCFECSAFSTRGTSREKADPSQYRADF